MITLCAEEVCPVWPGEIARMHRPLADPASVQTETSAATVAALFRVVRDELRCRLWLLSSANLPDGVSLGPPIDAELPAIDALIRASALPAEVVRDRFPEAYVVARRGGEVVGVAALETHDRAGLLRSVAIAPAERRVDAAELDDVLQDVFVRVQRGLPGLRDEERFTSWLFQIA
ncbi:MAG: sigma factor [Solirubrobacterales bacterium]